MATSATRQSPQTLNCALRQQRHIFNKWLKLLKHTAGVWSLPAKWWCSTEEQKLCRHVWGVNTDHNDIQRKAAESSKSDLNKPLQLWILTCGLWTNHCRLSICFSWLPQIDCKLPQMVTLRHLFIFLVTVVSVLSVYIWFCQNIICIPPLHDVSHE